MDTAAGADSGGRPRPCRSLRGSVSRRSLRVTGWPGAVCRQGRGAGQVRQGFKCSHINNTHDSWIGRRVFFFPPSSSFMFISLTFPRLPNPDSLILLPSPPSLNPGATTNARHWNVCKGFLPWKQEKRSGSPLSECDSPVRHSRAWAGKTAGTFSF